jgi:hypothetical protein
MNAPLTGFLVEEPPSRITKPDEIEQLKQKIAQLEQALAARTEPPTSDPATLSESLLKDPEFILTMARFSEGLEGLASEASIRKKYGFTQETWERLGADDKLVEAIWLEKAARIRSGAAKTEKSQVLIVAAPDILSGIANSPTESAKHRVDAIKALDSFTGSPAAAAEQERFFITINLGADERLTFSGATRPNPNNGVTIIDTTATDLETIAAREDDRGPV